MVDTSVIGSVTWGFESGVKGTCPQLGSQKISVPSPVRRISSLRRGLVADNERDLLLLWLPSSHSSVVETYIPTYVLWIMAGTRLCMALVHAIQVVALVGVALWMGLFGGGGSGGGDLVRHWVSLWRDQQQQQPQEPLNQSGRIHHPQEWNPRIIQTEFETDHLPRLVVSVPPTSDPDWKAFFASKQSMILVQEERSLADPKAWEFLCHDYHQEPQDEEEERVALDQGMEYVNDYTAADADLYLVPCPPPVWSKSGPKLIQDATTGTLFLLVPASSSSLSGRHKHLQQQVVHSHLFPMEEEEEEEGHATATTLSIPTCLDPVVQLHWLILDSQHQQQHEQGESWSILWNGWWPAMTRAQQSVSFLSWNGWVPWSVPPATTKDGTSPRGPVMAPFEIQTIVTGEVDGTNNHEENLESLRIHWTTTTTHSTSTRSPQQPQPRLFRSTIETWLSQQDHGSTTNTIPVYLLVQPDSYQSHPLQVVDNDQEDAMDESLKEDATVSPTVTGEKEDRILVEDSEATDENNDKKNVNGDNGINERNGNDKDKKEPDENESNNDSYATSATVLLSDDSLFIVLPPQVQDGIAQDVVRRISSWVTRRCLGLSQFPGELLDDDENEQDSSFVMNVEWMQYPSFESTEDWMHSTPNHPPSWFYNLFWRRALSELHRHAVEEADQALQRYKALEKQQQEQEETVQEQQTDDLSSALTSVWKVFQEWTGWQPPLPQALSWPVERAQRRLFQAEQALRLQHDYALAAQILLGHDDDDEEDNHHDKDLPPPQTNPVVLTQLVLDFGWEQYAALLAPLLIPLVLPALLGVGKELSRYWKKRNAKKTKQKQSATTQ